MSTVPNTPFCRVEGNFLSILKDSIDVDDLPDFIPVSGHGYISLQSSFINVDAAVNKSILFVDKIDFVIDSLGNISKNGSIGVIIPSPAKLRYTLTLFCGVGGRDSTERSVTYSTDFFSIPSGVVDVSVSGLTP